MSHKYKVGDIVYTKRFEDMYSEEMTEEEKRHLVSFHNGAVSSYFGFTKIDLDELFGVPLQITHTESEYYSQPCYKIKRQDGCHIVHCGRGYNFTEYQFFPDGMSPDEYYGANNDDLEIGETNLADFL